MPGSTAPAEPPSGRRITGAEGNEGVGRRAATANAMMTVWPRSYLVGLTDGRAVELPTFTP